MVEFKSYKHRLFILKRIVLSNMFRLLGPLNNYIQPRRAYCIKAGYHHAVDVETFDDRTNKDEWQRGVYASALSVFKKIDGESVIDLGCGSAFKLLDLFGSYDTMGIELTDTYHWLVKKYPIRKWLPFEKTNASQLKTDLVICSDVIEHIKNPDDLMDFLKKIRFRRMVISTPERNQARGTRDFGPPENTSHYREWNKEEFKEYVSKWFTITEQIFSYDKSPSQILVCTS
jgi:hypothetical protein